MGRQQCKWYIKNVLEIIGDDNILLQLDGYKSMLNALETEDKDGHIFELISPGDCTDLCSMPDCSVGTFVKGETTNILLVTSINDPMITLMEKLLQGKCVRCIPNGSQMPYKIFTKITSR